MYTLTKDAVSHRFQWLCCTLTYFELFGFQFKCSDRLSSVRLTREGWRSQHRSILASLETESNTSLNQMGHIWCRYLSSGYVSPVIFGLVMSTFQIAVFDTRDGIYDCTWSERNENILVSACGDGSLKVTLCCSMGCPPFSSILSSRSGTSIKAPLQFEAFKSTPRNALVVL